MQEDKIQDRVELLICESMEPHVSVCSKLGYIYPIILLKRLNIGETL